MTGQERILKLNAALDGELDAMSALEFERTMGDDPALAAEYRRLAALRDAVRRHAPREAATQALADRIAAMAPAAPVADFAAARVRRPIFGIRPLTLAASFALAGFAVGAGLMSLMRPGPSQGVETALVSDFAEAAIAGQPFAVASSDRHTVKPWLASRTTVSATIVDLAAEGFPAGGRPRFGRRPDSPPTWSTGTTSTWSPSPSSRSTPRAQKGRGGIETVDGTTSPAGRMRTSPMSPSPTWTKRTLAEFVQAFRQAGKPRAERTAP